MIDAVAMALVSAALWSAALIDNATAQSMVPIAFLAAGAIATRHLTSRSRR